MDGQHLGFVGVGRMGGPMAGRLLDAGHRLTVFDTSPDALTPLAARGATVAASAAAVADEVETVLISLPTPEIVQQVALGGDGICEGERVKALIDLSTTGPATTARVAAGLAERNIQLVDSPVSGGVRGAREGALAVITACPRPLFDQLAPVLATFGKVFFVGEKPGLGQVVKLGNNLLSATALAISSEALAMGVKAGVDPRVMIEVINAGTGRNSATVDKFPRSILTGTFAHGFATGLLHKDVRLCVDEAEALGVPMILGAEVRQLLAITESKYGPDSDFTSIARVIEDWAGVEIRG